MELPNTFSMFIINQALQTLLLHAKQHFSEQKKWKENEHKKVIEIFIQKNRKKNV